MEGILPEEAVKELRVFSKANDVGVQYCHDFNARFIIQELCDMKGEKIEDVLGKSKNKELVNIRHLAMYLIRVVYFPSMGLINIGKLFGGRDHSTVIHAIKTLEGYMRYDSKVKQEIIDLQKHFNKYKINYESNKNQ